MDLAQQAKVICSCLRRGRVICAAQELLRRGRKVLYVPPSDSSEYSVPREIISVGPDNQFSSAVDLLRNLIERARLKSLL
jgi:hypothetical protein